MKKRQKCVNIGTELLKRQTDFKTCFQQIVKVIGTMIYKRFDDQSTSKPDKAALVTELLIRWNILFKKRAPSIVDFMSHVRKVPLGDKKTFRDVLDFLFEQIRFACKSHQIDVIYDSYLEFSTKECEIVRGAKSITLVEYALLAAEANIPVEMDLFWASNKNKELLEVLSRNYFVGLASKQGVKTVLSGYVDDGYGT